MVSREELQVKLNVLLEQREQLSAEIAGMYSRIRRLKKANKTGTQIMAERVKQAFPSSMQLAPSRAQLEELGDRLARGEDLTEEELAALEQAQK